MHYLGQKSFFIVFIGIFSIIASCKKDATDNPVTSDFVTDIDGNIYHFDTIGNQIWMRENLNTTRYRNGDEIPFIPDTNTWTKLKTAAYCNSRNSDSLAYIYGRLYNWYVAANPCGVCPEGWHIPSYSEWMELVTYLGGDKIAGLKLREAGTVHWTYNYNATNESGFTALPGGYRSEYNGWYNSLGTHSFWWTGTEQDSLWAVYCWIFFSDGSFNRKVEVKDAGFSLRCIRDQ